MFPPTQRSNKTVYPVLLDDHYGFGLMFILAQMFPLQYPMDSLFGASILVLALQNLGNFRSFERWEMAMSYRKQKD